MQKKSKIKYFSVERKNIIVPFEDFFDDENASDYDEFFMSIATKKTYTKIADLICKENNIVLNKNQELAERFITTYFTIKYSIDRGEYDKKYSDTFVKDLITLLFPVDFMMFLHKYIEDNYKTNVDAKMDLEKHRFDKGTTFQDRHYKILYLISTMSRLVIPLVTHYIYNYKFINDINGFIMNVFIELFKLAQTGTDSNIYAKLHLFVQRATIKTTYTDAPMWDRLRILGVTPEVIIEDIMNKLVTNVIPKYDFNMNIMNLNTVVIRKSIMSYTLRREDPYTLFSISNTDGHSSDDDSILSEVEIFDSYNTQRDESIILYRKYGTARDVDIIAAREGIILNQDEIDFYKSSTRYHELQKSAIYYVFDKYFSGIENIIGGCRAEDWIKLIIVLKKMLERMGLDYLSNFISGEKVAYSYRKLSKYMESLIVEDPMYQEIMDKKYKSVQGFIEKRNPIKNMIISIFNNTYTYNAYNNPMNGKYIEKDEEKIVREVLNFFNSFIL